MASFSASENVSTNPYDVAIVQFVSNPLGGAQSISGTVKGIIRASENSASANYRAQMVIRVLSEDFATVRGTLLASDVSALSNEFDTVLTNRKFPLNWAGAGASVTTVNAEHTDRIVIEIGYRSHNASTSSFTGSLRLGDPIGSTDLAENEVDTLDNTPWVEFSQTLNFLSSFDTDPARAGQKLNSPAGPSSSLRGQRGQYQRFGEFATQPLVRSLDVGPNQRGAPFPYKRWGEFSTNPDHRSKNLIVDRFTQALSGGPSLTHYYKKRARDAGAFGTVYVTWVTTDPFSAYPDPPPFGGPLVEQVVVETWDV